MPMPITPRAMVSSGRFCASVQATVPAMATSAAAMIARRRPSRSPSREAAAAPIIAPTERLAVTTPF